MLKTRIGLVLFTLGIVTADSEWLIVPITLVAIGAWLMRDIIGGNDNVEM